ncbi:hypothetical protein ACN38_g10337 [Penicillium nordicum]|uniref:Uncharacterized protein n=1 Tax=Penicillium nordicum TaxID=229535 RepID=A0A0M8P1Q8_9EURO|nr:hypothetical protein ACN38_g10337 [Penicillium nordicum]
MGVHHRPARFIPRPLFYLLRTFLHPRYVLHQLRNNGAETLCLCYIPIAFTSILQMAVFKYGDIAGLAIYILWWVNTGMDIITCMVSPFMCHKMQQSGTQAYMLMPFLVVLTSNAGSGVICQPARISPLLQVSAIIISHLKIGAGLNLVNSFVRSR